MDQTKPSRGSSIRTGAGNTSSYGLQPEWYSYQFYPLAHCCFFALKCKDFMFSRHVLLWLYSLMSSILLVVMMVNRPESIYCLYIATFVPEMLRIISRNTKTVLYCRPAHSRRRLKIDCIIWDCISTLIAYWLWLMAYFLKAACFKH